MSFISAAAVNAGVVLERRQSEEDFWATKDFIKGAMFERARRILQIARNHGHQDLVLGAWGTGVFRNDSKKVAAMFHTLLISPKYFANVFRRVVFAIATPAVEKHTGKDPSSPYTIFRSVFDKDKNVAADNKKDPKTTGAHEQ